MATTGKWASAKQTLILVFLVLFSILNIVPSYCVNGDKGEDAWKKKDVRDYTDADLERLYEQWEEDEEELPEDELPEWKRPQPKIDLSKIDANDPESMLHMTKKGKTLMMFATVSGDPPESDTEDITRIWQSSLFNANYDVQRYIVGSNRVLFVLKDGSKAWEIKDYLIRQDRCQVVTIEGKDYHGKASPDYEEPLDNMTRPPSKPTKPKKDKIEPKKTNKIEL